MRHFDFSFTVEAADAATAARAGVITTAAGVVLTPAFTPVATLGSVKTLTPAELRECGVRIVLGNTYHLLHQPGVGVVERMGGLARFMGWDGPTVTDSGGFQVFSLAATRRIEPEGVRFRSVYDGRELNLTPETVYDLERRIGADIIYPLDECTPYPSSHDDVARAVELTTSWAERFVDASQRGPQPRQAVFLIVQGGVFEDLRLRSIEQLLPLEPDGFAVGGVSVGEPNREMLAVARLCTANLPPDKPRHLMGVGTPLDLLRCIGAGYDLFDCVIPTRNGRNGQAFTGQGTLNLRNARFRDDSAPLDETCGCYCCRTFTRSYLHHLVAAGELLGLHMLSLHNIAYYQRLMQDARAAIISGGFTALCSGMEALQRGDA